MVTLVATGTSSSSGNPASTVGEAESPTPNHDGAAPDSDASASSGRRVTATLSATDAFGAFTFAAARFGVNDGVGSWSDDGVRRFSRSPAEASPSAFTGPGFGRRHSAPTAFRPPTPCRPRTCPSPFRTA